MSKFIFAFQNNLNNDTGNDNPGNNQDDNNEQKIPEGAVQVTGFTGEYEKYNGIYLAKPTSVAGGILTMVINMIIFMKLKMHLYIGRQLYLSGGFLKTGWTLLWQQKKMMILNQVILQIIRMKCMITLIQIILLLNKS